ncbi:hypothetical protein ID0617_10470 [Helicobacter pylori]
MRSFKIICGSGGDQNGGDLDRSVKGFLMICFANKKTAIKNLKMLKAFFIIKIKELAKSKR